MQTEEAIRSIASDLVVLRNIDLGYPLGVNEVRQPVANFQEVLGSNRLLNVPGLLELYNSCDGMSLPDVHNGYFLKQAIKLSAVNPDSEPHTALLGGAEVKILTVGSTGGGTLFAAEYATGRVLILPPSYLQAGIYDGRHSEVTIMEGGLREFMSRLANDVAAFVHDRHDYKFMV